MRDMDIARFIDHTNLNPCAVERDIETLCGEALKWGFASVCINSCHVSFAAGLLAGSSVKVCSVVGFPLGACATECKSLEAAIAMKNGASEVDMVMNLSWLKDGFYDRVKEDIASVVESAPKCKVKVIIETCLLSDEEKITACGLIKEGGAHFVKTSTGFSRAGASVHDVRLIRGAVGVGFGVKASGGIRDYESAVAMINAGADRLGTSGSVSICERAKIIVTMQNSRV